jgi:threonine 3-dehydrogenase
VHTAQQFDLMGENVLVTGAGPIGIMAAAVARRAGARSVVITDINPYRLDLAARLADVRPVNTQQEDLRDVMAAEGVDDGFAVALEMSGAQPAIRQAVDALRMGGGLAMLGIPGGTMDVNWSDIILKALTIRGVYGREMFGTWQKMFGLIRSGLDLAPLITHRLDAADFQQGFDAMRSGQAGTDRRSAVRTDRHDRRGRPHRAGKHRPRTRGRYRRSGHRPDRRRRADRRT